MRITSIFLVTRKRRQPISSARNIVNTEIHKNQWNSKGSHNNNKKKVKGAVWKSSRQITVVPLVLQILLLILGPLQWCKYPDHILLHLESSGPATGRHPEPGWPIKMENDKSRLSVSAFAAMQDHLKYLQ